MSGLLTVLDAQEKKERIPFPFWFLSHYRISSSVLIRELCVEESDSSSNRWNKIQKYIKSKWLKSESDIMSTCENEPCVAEWTSRSRVRSNEKQSLSTFVHSVTHWIHCTVLTLCWDSFNCLLDHSERFRCLSSQQVSPLRFKWMFSFFFFFSGFQFGSLQVSEPSESCGASTWLAVL